ncbi:MAG TPA: DNA mismatch repair endonuclease MutL [Clostridia bacterium]|nr:DNA mismatch repair endonuclease MutL [Clostridia bacterium]
MKRIRVLDKYTADRIAAGEVVERPASVVKELVENALDAGARSISVETQGGGLDLIRAMDDGCGIPFDEVQTAFLRHATSKIEHSDDLAHIETLGFRGEALSSIAAVARVEMRTKTKDATSGAQIRLEGGDVLSLVESGVPDGTSVEVADLFYNVPARLKFVKNARAEAAYVSDYVSRMIMARPDVSFRLAQSGKTVYRSAGDGDFLNAIYCVYGAEVMPHLKKIEYDDGYVALSGYVGTEQIGRANRTAQSFFINGRYIKSQKLSFALQRAYDARLMTGKFPFCALSIALNSQEIDVNVHPNKLDVRFRQEERIVRALLNAARSALNEVTVFRGAIESTHEEARPERPAFGRTDEVLRLEALPPEAFAAKLTEKVVFRDIGAAPPQQAQTVPPVAATAPISTPRPTAREEQLNLGAKDIKIIGQLFDCYWVAQLENTVFFIDQHAAHERRLYEQIVKSGVNVDSQLLLVPEIVKLSPYEYDTLTSNLGAFTELGFEITEFGPLTVSVRAVPSILGAPQTAAFLREAIEQLDKKYRLNTVELKRAALIRAACRRAIKAGERPDPSEIAELLALYEREGIPMTCPHGRPVMIAMTRLEFEKLFKRVL